MRHVTQVIFWSLTLPLLNLANHTECAISAADTAPAQSTKEKPPFPHQGLLPKVEIGATRFLQQHPKYDGRGVVVAIFDTGVDPTASGLQVTTDGRPKILDLIDGTGSGDVDTSTVQIAHNGTLKGLSGKTLKLSPDWVSASREFHLGLKAAYQLYPPALVNRLKAERREAFIAQQRSAETALREQIDTLSRSGPTTGAKTTPNVNDLRERLRQLRRATTDFKDPGPLFDCLVFHDGARWRAVVDTDEDGDLAEEDLLTNFRDQRQYSRFRGSAELPFSVNIFSAGNLLSIVTTSDPHGTHVAGIVGAHFQNQPELNGVAPGVQIVSVKIGDTRLGSMETASGLERGVIATIANGCDLVNMSFGEPTRTPDRGWLTKLFAQLVDDHGVIFVASAGNAGPALSTVGAPGATTSALLGVGAYLSPAMMSAQYAALNTRPELPYTFTSRGPTFDGHLGVAFCAPGGAVAPVPAWTRNLEMQMNGTSMASPNACGAIALLLSAAKSQRLHYTPAHVRRALENTARPLQGSTVFSQGRGLIQVDLAWKHLTTHHSAMAEHLDFSVQIARQGNTRGIYLREATATQRTTESVVSVKPAFPKQATTSERAQFQLRLQLDTTQPWIRTAKHLLMHHSGSRFRVRIDPRQLPPGVHYGEIRMVSTDAPARGPLVRVPVTVVIAEPLAATEANWQETLSLQAGTVHRRFLRVPHTARWINLRVRRNVGTGRRRIVVHTVQKLDDNTFRNGQYKRYHTFSGGDVDFHRIPVAPDHTMELCIAQDWRSEGATELTCQIAFQGPAPYHETLSLTHHGAVVNARIHSGPQRTVVAPRAELTEHRQTVAPERSVVRPLSAQRDRLPDGRQLYQLVLTYNFELKTTGLVTPRFPYGDDRLYEAVQGVPFWMLFNAHRQLIAVDDIWPSALQLQPGKYQIHLQLRHEDASRLEALQHAPLQLDRKLSRSIALPVFPDRGAADRKGPQATTRTLHPGASLTFAIKPLADSALPPQFGPGDSLLGRIYYGRSATEHSPNYRHPVGYPLTYYGALAAQRPKQVTAAVPQSTTDLEEERWNSELGQLQRLIESVQGDLFEELSTRLLEQRPGALSVLVAQLHRLDRPAVRKKHLRQVQTAADAILKTINRKRLARYFADVSENNRQKDPALHQQRTGERTHLIDTLYRKGRALGYMELPDVIQVHPIKNQRAHDRLFEANFQQLARWVDTTDRKYCLLHVRRDRRQQRYGAALRLLNQHIRAGNATYWFYKKRRDLYELAGWQHLRDYEHRWLLLRFPTQQVPF